MVWTLVVGPHGADEVVELSCSSIKLPAETFGPIRACVSQHHCEST